MSAGVELRPVREPLEEPASAPPEEPRRSYGRTAVVLGFALALVLGGWVLSEVERGRERVSLESRLSVLEQELAQRDAALAAQEQRIQDVRDHLDVLRQLLDRPLTTKP